jgi:hypothetical protein
MLNNELSHYWKKLVKKTDGVADRGIMNPIEKRGFILTLAVHTLSNKKNL